MCSMGVVTLVFVLVMGHVNIAPRHFTDLMYSIQLSFYIGAECNEFAVIIRLRELFFQDLRGVGFGE